MSRTGHFIYVYSMVLISVAITIYIGISGYSYYSLPLEERFYHDQYDWFKPSGIFGQGLGVIGTTMMFFGVFISIAHKRYNVLGRWVRLKYLLEFHIFLCTLGPILILFHTTFKFGGIVSVAFWSMVAVVLSGVAGRFIYLQIPRSIEGRALSLDELKQKKDALLESLSSLALEDSQSIQNILESNTRSGWRSGKSASISKVKKLLKQKGIDRSKIKAISQIVKDEVSLSHKIGRLETMQKLFNYWHVIHMPFAIIMLVIVVVHVAVAISFGYNWIF